MPPQNTAKNQYQRLEFLGDRVLNLVVSDILFSQYPEWSEGDLTKMLGFASNDNLEGLLNELDKSIISALLTFKQSFGEYYLKHGWTETKTYIEKVFGKLIREFDPETNYIGILQELTQKELKIVPDYVLESQEGPPHQPVFHIKVNWGNVVGRGIGNSLHEARKQAALAALKELKM